MKVSSFIIALVIVLVCFSGLLYLREVKDNYYTFKAGTYYFVKFEQDGTSSVKIGDVDLRLYEIKNNLALFTAFDSSIAKSICSINGIVYDTPLLITDYIAFPDQVYAGVKKEQFIGFRYYWYVLTGRRHEYEAEQDLYYTPFTYTSILIDYDDLPNDVHSSSFASSSAEFMSTFRSWILKLKAVFQ